MASSGVSPSPLPKRPSSTPSPAAPVNGNFADYHVPVNADIGTLDVTVLNIPETKFNPLGARGIGEIGITGVPAAIANAVYHATGKRVRELPITLDKLMDPKAVLSV